MYGPYADGSIPDLGDQRARNVVTGHCRIDPQCSAAGGEPIEDHPTGMRWGQLRAARFDLEIEPRQDRSARRAARVGILHFGTAATERADQAAERTIIPLRHIRLA